MLEGDRDRYRPLEIEIARDSQKVTERERHMEIDRYIDTDRVK